MLAFNRRFDIKRVVGLQVPMAMGLLGMLITGVFALMLPWPIKALVLILFVFAFGTVIVVAYYGEDIVFSRVMMDSKRHQKLTTAEHTARL